MGACDNFECTYLGQGFQRIITWAEIYLHPENLQLVQALPMKTKNYREFTPSIHHFTLDPLTIWKTEPPFHTLKHFGVHLIENEIIWPKTHISRIDAKCKYKNVIFTWHSHSDSYWWYLYRLWRCCLRKLGGRQVEAWEKLGGGNRIQKSVQFRLVNATTVHSDSERLNYCRLWILAIYSRFCYKTLKYGHFSKTKKFTSSV